MNRRGFFKVLVAGAAAAAAPQVLLAAEPEEAVKPGFSLYGELEESIAYDAYEDVYLVRHDMRDVGGFLIFAVVHKVYGKPTEEHLLGARDQSKRLILERLARA